jgi:dynein assembly factor with WDR repeat domains 1
VLDIAFNLSGSRIATASADKTSMVFDANTYDCLHVLKGHDNEISKVKAKPKSSRAEKDMEGIFFFFDIY